MSAQQADLRADVPVVNNPAKRLAGQMMNRWVAVFGAGLMAPVARRWKGQVSELAKAWAQFEALPEADHNTLAGSLNPDGVLGQTLALFLRSPSDHHRNALRIDITKRVLMLEGVGTDFVDARGETPLDNLWTALHFGDYTGYYLAMCYDVDPTPVDALQALKQELASKS
jgi:glucose/mannose-6-phosphate isomerase